MAGEEYVLQDQITMAVDIILWAKEDSLMVKDSD